MRKTLLLAIAFALAGCGGSPSGKLTGKVSVTGGTLSAGNITVTAIGPNGGGASTDMSGGYEIDGLADGAYAVSAVLAGTNEGEVRVVAAVKGGKGSAPELKFTALTPPPTPQAGVVSGKASYSDGSDSSGITVTLTGPGSQGLAAMTDGSFSFANVAPGTYTLAADAADSLEHRVTVAVQVTGGMTTTVPNLTLTAVGAITGKATRGSGATGNAGITVAVAGTSYRATTADDGSYALTAVPAGMQTLIASLPDYDPATAMVTVVRGSTMAMDLSISKLSTHGSVTGVVLFADQQDRSIITVRADGTTLSTRCDSNGNFTLPLPAGHFSIFADAPNFPSRPLGQVAVDDGTVVGLPGVVMSPWFDFPVEPGAAAGPSLKATKDGDHALYTLSFAGTPQYRMIDLRTGAQHTFFSASFGAGLPSVVSPHGRYFAQYAPNVWVIFDTQTAAFNTLTVLATPPADNIATFTDDEKFFLVADGTKIHRFEVTTAIDNPITAVAGTDFLNDAFLVQDVQTIPYTLSYAKASGTPASVATGVTKHTSFVSGQTVIWNNCSSSCAVHLLDETSGAVANPSGAFDSALVVRTAVGSGAWIEFAGSGGGFMNVATTNFTIPPVGLFRYAFNPSGTSVLYEINGPPIVLHLESGAPTGAGTIVGSTSTGSFGIGTNSSNWLDDNRAIAFGPSPLTRYNILNGAVTTDTDLVSRGQVFPPVAYWQRNSDKSFQFAEREYADLAVTYSMAGGPAGFCESLDGQTLFVGGQDINGANYDSTIVRTNATGAMITVPGFVTVEAGRCLGNSSAFSTTLVADELIVASGQTIWHAFDHQPGRVVPSLMLGADQMFGTQIGPSGFPSLMLVP